MVKKTKKKKPSNGVQNLTSQRVVVGKNAISELLQAAPRRCLELWTTHTQGLVIDLARRADIPVLVRTTEELFDCSRVEAHQGYLAWVSDAVTNLDDILTQDAANSLLVAALGLEDAHNLGSVFRAAECFGANGVLYTRNKGVGITAATTKVSVGGTELVPAVSIGNVSRALTRIQEAGYWLVAAAGGDGSQNVYDFSFPAKTVLLLGNEGKGLGKLVHSQADFSIGIPMLGKIDSLNVSQAAAVLLYEYRRQHTCK